MPSPTAAEARGSLHMSSSILPAQQSMFTGQLLIPQIAQLLWSIQRLCRQCKMSGIGAIHPYYTSHVQRDIFQLPGNQRGPTNCGVVAIQKKKTATNLGSLSEFSVPNKVILNCNIEFVWPCTKLWVFRMQLWFKVWLFWIRLVSKPFKNQFSYKLRKE